MLHKVLIAGAIIGATAIFLTAWYQRWKRHAMRYSESGYTPPPTAFMVELIFSFFCRLYAFLTVGPVTTASGVLEATGDGKFVFRTSPRDETGRLIFIANHQVPADFAMVRHVSNRHFRTMTSANELEGGKPMAVGSAATGVISVGFANKEDGAKATRASIKALGADYFRIEPSLARFLLVGSFIAGAIALYCGAYIALAGAALLFVFASCMPSSEQGFTIFPQGALLPDDPNFDENFRPGAVRIAEAVAATKGDANVKIVPIAIYLKRDKKKQHWSHRYLRKMRSSFFALRRPTTHSIFKIGDAELNAMSQDARSAIITEREALMSAYKKSRGPIYGAVVVRGNAIARSELPAGDIEASNALRERVRALYEVAASL